MGCAAAEYAKREKHSIAILCRVILELWFNDCNSTRLEDEGTNFRSCGTAAPAELRVAKGGADMKLRRVQLANIRSFLEPTELRVDDTDILDGEYGDFWTLLTDETRAEVESIVHQILNLQPTWRSRTTLPASSVK